MRMTLLTGCSIIYFTFISCGPEPDDKIFFNNIQIENESSKDIKIRGYHTYDQSYDKPIIPAILTENIEILANSKSDIVVCETRFSPIENATFFSKTPTDSIFLEFEDGKNYISFRNINFIDNSKWILNKSSLLSLSVKNVRKEGDVYIYTITQEDYENAHVLP